MGVEVVVDNTVQILLHMSLRVVHVLDLAFEAVKGSGKVALPSTFDSTIHSQLCLSDC